MTAEVLLVGTVAIAMTTVVMTVKEREREKASSKYMHGLFVCSLKICRALLEPDCRALLEVERFVVWPPFLFKTQIFF